MPRFAIVPMSRLDGRLDAEYHVAVSAVRDRAEALEASMTRDEALRRLDGFTLADKAGLLVLARGTPRLSTAAVDAVAAERPHLALALLERDLAPAAGRIRDEIARTRADAARREAALDALVSAAPAVDPSPGPGF